MNKKSKEVHLKLVRTTVYLFNDMINTKNLDTNQIKIDKKSYKNILIYHIRCVTVKVFSYATIIIVNHVCLTIGKINRMY